MHLLNPGGLFKGSSDLSILPDITIVDMISFFMGNGLSHATIRDYSKSEGYSMMKDRFVNSVTVLTLVPDQYFALTGQEAIDKKIKVCRPNCL